MRKILIDSVPNQIHIDDVDLKSVIIVKEKGTAVGMICHNDTEWLTVLSGVDSDYHSSLPDAIKWFDPDYEFYVLD
jgi:hypothetical protein